MCRNGANSAPQPKSRRSETAWKPSDDSITPKRPPESRDSSSKAGASIAQPLERRHSLGAPFTAGVVELDAHTTDLSASGSWVDTMSPLPAQTEIQWQLTNNGKSFHTKARVIYCQTGVRLRLESARCSSDGSPSRAANQSRSRWPRALGRELSHRRRISPARLERTNRPQSRIGFAADRKACCDGGRRRSDPPARAPQYEILGPDLSPFHRAVCSCT